MRTGSTIKRRFVGKLTVVLLAIAAAALCGCSAQSPGFESAEGKPTPYILKDGCRFTIVEELSRAGITSPEVTGMDGARASLSITLGAKSITLSDCTVTQNSHSLPIYEG
jgi:hypothetical protein